MSKVKVELNLRGINELMRGPAMQAVLQQAGEKVAAQAAAMDSAEYAAQTYQIRWIAVTNVFPDSADAAHKNFERNTLLKVISGGN